MENIVNVNYNCTGVSTEINKMGMREMQERAYQKRGEAYLLLKAPPASGKSRALMYVALDKLENQEIRKVIVAVPERTIGASFAPVKLTESGFFSDWSPEARYNLCTPGADAGKVARFKEFMESESRILICTHATLRFAFEQIPTRAFNKCLLGIDEFHHVSADRQSSRLGDLLHQIITETNAHILAMTGSYFRGDNVPILLPEDEVCFSRVVYTYYDQLNGYKYLKSLGIGYHFYQGKYLSALPEVLDLDKKTIIHIPNVNSAESTKDKYSEANYIIDYLGEVESVDKKTGILNVRCKDGKTLRVADLVEDDMQIRERIVSALRNPEVLEKIDIIIALGMAKEGFDWPMCEHALTVGYRGSLTEIVQIIGRCTRDYPGKVHTQFTNLLASPKATNDEIILSVNNMLKAITGSLLMEQVMTPELKLKAPNTPEESSRVREDSAVIYGFRSPSTKRVKDIVENDIHELTAHVLQDEDVKKAMVNKELSPLVMNKTLIPRVIAQVYPDLTSTELEEVRQQVVARNVLKRAVVKKERDGKEFIKMGEQFVNVDRLSINLIDQINPFQEAFEVLSKLLNSKTLGLIRDAILETRITITKEEAVNLWDNIKAFKNNFDREPNASSDDVNEKLLGEALVLIKRLKREREAKLGY